MGKVEIGNTGMFIVMNSPLHFVRLLFKSHNLIGCRGDIHVKGKISKNIFKNLPLRNYKGDEAETWHIC